MAPVKNKKSTTSSMQISKHDREGLLGAMGELMNRNSEDFRSSRDNSYDCNKKNLNSMNSGLVLSTSQSRSTRSVSQSDTRSRSSSSLRAASHSSITPRLSQRRLVKSKNNKSKIVASRPKVIRKHEKLNKRNKMLKSNSLSSKNIGRKSIKSTRVKSSLNISRSKSNKSGSKLMKRKSRFLKSENKRNIIKSRSKTSISRSTKKLSRSRSIKKKLRCLNNNTMRNSNTSRSIQSRSRYTKKIPRCLININSMSNRNKSNSKASKQNPTCIKLKRVNSRSISIKKYCIRKRLGNTKSVKPKTRINNSKNKIKRMSISSKKWNLLKMKSLRSSSLVKMKRRCKSTNKSAVCQGRMSIRLSSKKSVKRPARK